MIPLNKLIYDLVEDIAGEEIIPLIDLLWGKEHVSEFKLADKLEITVNKVRNMLYKLHSHNLVTFIRKKDKRKGWYIYYWTFDLKQALDFLIYLKKERVILLGDKLSQRQIEDYFRCPNKCVIYKYDIAMESDFKCPECGSVLEKLDMKKQVFRLKKKIKILGNELEDAGVYLKEEIEKIEKKKARLEKRLKKKVKRKRKKKVKKKKIKKKAKKKFKKKAKKRPKKKVKKKKKKKVKKKKKKKAKKKKKSRRKRR